MFIVQALRLYRGYTPERAIRFFTMSNTYLALLFAAIALDTISNPSDPPRRSRGAGGDRGGLVAVVGV